MIDREQVKKVAHLARLQLTEPEVEEFTHQLGDLLEYFEQLNALDVTEVPPTTRAIEVSNVTRPDRQLAYPARQEILAVAPEPDGDFFKVPQIISSPD